MHDHHEHDLLEQDKLRALLVYMLGHNKHHTEELADAAHQLEHLGKGDAAALLKEGIAGFSNGNQKLAEALDILKEDK